MSESWLVELMQSVGMVHECLNAFFYIQWIERGSGRHKFRVTTRGRTKHFVGDWLSKVVCISSHSPCLCISHHTMLEIKRVFSTLAARSKFDRRICLTRDDRTKAGHRNMAQSIPSVYIPLRAFVGHLSFCFGKATNAPRWGLITGCK